MSAERGLAVDDVKGVAVNGVDEPDIADFLRLSSQKSQNGEREYHTLFRYKITKNELVNGKYKIEGKFEQPEYMSNHLKGKLMQFGVPEDLLAQFLKPKTAAKKKKGGDTE